MSTRQTFDTLDHLRVLIDRDPYPGELFNAIESPNGDNGLGAYGWNTPTPGTGITAQPGPPSRLAFLVFTGDTNPCAFTSQVIDLEGGQWIAGQYLEYPPVSVGGPHRSRFVFFNAAGDQIGAAAYSPYWLNYDAPTLRTRPPVQAPAGTSYARLRFDCYSVGVGDPPTPGIPVTGHRFDFGSVIVAVADTAAHLADLTQAKAGYPTLDITGEVGELTITRTALDVGTVTARLAATDLDPAVTDDLRPGRRLTAATAAGAPLFAGRTGPLRTDYSLTQPRGVVSLAATDNVSVLAMSPVPESFTATDDLRVTLDRSFVPVPWDVNGSGSQRLFFGSDAVDSGATLLDQIIRTRDTNGAHAWVDSTGILRVRDGYLMPTEPVDTLTDDDYAADLAPAFDTAAAVNSVTVTVWTGATSVTHGPYRDYQSVKRWGELTANYTVIDTDPAAFAAMVLAANATPAVTVERVTVALSTPDRVERFTRIELCDLLHLTCEDPALDLEVRVTSIEHRIARDRWLTTFGLVLADRLNLPSV